MARRTRTRLTFRGAVVLLFIALGGIFAWRLLDGNGGSGETASPTPSPHTRSSPSGGRPTTPTPGPINNDVPGLTTWRGNATRDYYGEGPVPKHPIVRWTYPVAGELCSRSVAAGETKKWCGTGWTGQPNVVPHPDGTVEVRIGAYDRDYHFLNGRTGQPVRPDLVTGDLAKGSATSDPDGYPLYYGGSRDNLLRVIALDRTRPTVLWSLDAETSVPDPIWNNDWDGAPLVIGDYLLEGGENSWFYVIKLNRGYDRDHLVTVHPHVVFKAPGWDDRLLADLPDQDISIESSVAYDRRRGVVYFANSGGLVQGWDVSRVLHGGTQAKRVFRFWTGDDTDATVVIDRHGSLYVGSEYQRHDARSAEVGQIMKLDPSRPADPLVWSIHSTAIAFEDAGGTWSTPALYGRYVYESTVDGKLMEIEKRTGKVVWTVELTSPVLSSPVVVDDVLIQGDCSGTLRAFDVSRPHARPRELWAVPLATCIESTPAVWHGWIYVGTRGGAIYGIAGRAR